MMRFRPSTGKNRYGATEDSAETASLLPDGAERLSRSYQHATVPLFPTPVDGSSPHGAPSTTTTAEQLPNGWSARRLTAMFVVTAAVVGVTVCPGRLPRGSPYWSGTQSLDAVSSSAQKGLWSSSSNCRHAWEALHQWQHHHRHHKHYHYGDSFRGRILGPHQRGFAESHRVWNRLLDNRPPCAVLEPESAEIVAQALPLLEQLSSAHGVPWSIRSGGHNYAGWSEASDGVVLSLARLDDWKLEFPPKRSRTPSEPAVATFGPGLSTGELLRRALKNGYGGVVGSAATVGLGGWVLGGGFGYWSRKHGLGIDNLLELQAVLPNASIVTASAAENPELFWALRGAGQSNFGVVTRYKYRLYPAQPEVLVVTGYLPHRSAAQLLDTAGRDDTENGLPSHCHLEVNSDEGGMLLFVACLGAAKRDLYEGEVAVRHFLRRTLGAADAKKFQYANVSWYQAAKDEAAEFEGFLSQVWNGFLLPSGDQNRDRKTWDALATALWEACRDNPYVLLDVELKGGAIAAVASDATAFPWRNATYNVGVVVYVSHREKHALEIYEREAARMQKLWERDIAPHLHGTFANYAMASLKDVPAAQAAALAWGNNLDRLERIKAEFDPLNEVHTVLSVPLPPIVDTSSPTGSPTSVPTLSPTEAPTPTPTVAPSPAPTELPSPAPTRHRTETPSDGPSRTPLGPTRNPTGGSPSLQPVAPPAPAPTGSAVDPLPPESA